MAKGFLIKERWKVSGEIETYENTRKTEEQVSDYIRGWIDGWIDSTQEHEYKILTITTDWKTEAFVRIETGTHIDTMRLKVIKNS